MRFEFPTTGHIYDIRGLPLIELAREYRQITQYEDIPPIVRNAILATEDRHLFSHNGVDYLSLPRVVGKVRLGAWMGRLVTGGRQDNTSGRAIFPQGGSTITQQLVRGAFLQRQTSQENSDQLRNIGLVPRALSSVIGARNVNMALRKREEIRLSLWIEAQMRMQFGSKRRAKEEIFARYASFAYMGNGQYGFARAAEYYFGRPLATFTAEDADKAALLAGILKSPRAIVANTRSGARVASSKRSVRVSINKSTSGRRHGRDWRDAWLSVSTKAAMPEDCSRCRRSSSGRIMWYCPRVPTARRSRRRWIASSVPRSRDAATRRRILRSPRLSSYSFSNRSKNER